MIFRKLSVNIRMFVRFHSFAVTVKDALPPPPGSSRWGEDRTRGEATSVRCHPASAGLVLVEAENINFMT